MVDASRIARDCAIATGPGPWLLCEVLPEGFNYV